MKIVITSNSSWSIWNFRLNLATALTQAGHEVIIIAPFDKYTEIIQEKYQYYNIQIKNTISPIEELKIIRNYTKLYKQIKPDIVLGFTVKANIYSNVACKKLNIKTINNISGLGSMLIRDNLLSKIIKIFYRYSLKSSSQIFFQNQDDLQLFLKEKLVDISKTKVLPGSGVDVNKFNPIVPMREKDGVIRFLVIARLIWDKGIKEYIEAAEIIKRKYKNTQFLLIGELGVDNPTSIPKEYIEEWQNKGVVEYLGTSDNIQKEIAEIDCVVLPSYREGTSRALLESAALAKPIIASNVPGCKNIVEDNVTGFLCKPQDKYDLVDKIEKMINLTESQREEMGKKGREKIVREFNETFVIDAYLTAINNLNNNQKD